jgi:hypothetical protein
VLHPTTLNIKTPLTLFRSGHKNSPTFLTQDEENSGIVEITDLVRKAPWFEVNKRYFLGAIQVHAKSTDPELVEDGQLYLITGPNAQ